MTQAQEILRLIETVDPSDTAKLDEIDARVAFFVQGFKWGDDHAVARFLLNPYPKYTRDRNALKEIRPEDGYLKVERDNRNDLWFAEIWVDRGHIMQTHGLPKEELAELHAIIQAIEYERTTK